MREDTDDLHGSWCHGPDERSVDGPHDGSDS
jgi:hypothetical protein